MPADFADVLTNQPVVIDNGSGTIKAGFAGQEQPKCYFPNFVGRPKHQKVMMGGLEEADVYIGRKAQELRGLLKIKYPVEHGIVTDWDDMETIWKYVYHDELGTLPEEVCVLHWLLLPNINAGANPLHPFSTQLFLLKHR
ncbi:Actin-2 [Naganishia cerealis]|uniref:Actin-2 n=1 Tax=Naganishia cerealis TaxID=610337 RepID=A0ACC2WKK9_9TREE|nr:Actin-2 [Naganishia cerealis]